MTIERRYEGRRAGDPAALVADNRAILAALPWRPQRDDLDTIRRWTAIVFAKVFMLSMFAKQPWVVRHSTKPIHSSPWRGKTDDHSNLDQD
ncbi:hypothetical protein WR25_13761 [Diploscapter pachys]|uniref:Uncharacterized protein n=1 Tax=Diploscapter pachys TaxID=2018661 RepID=A0A2A2K484_9BILA|nr:hypothetical protein WR25_13761 [Diploscapter pachys]